MNDPLLKALANALVIFKLQTPFFHFFGHDTVFLLLAMDLKCSLNSLTRLILSLSYRTSAIFSLCLALVQSVMAMAWLWIKRHSRCVHGETEVTLSAWLLLGWSAF